MANGIDYDALEIPGIPDDNALRAEILASDPTASLTPYESLSNVKITRPGAPAAGERLTAAELSAKLAERDSLSPETQRLAQVGRLGRGMADNANPYHVYLEKQARNEKAAWATIDRLTDQVSEIASYDPQTGEPIYVMSPARRIAAMNEISNAGETLDRMTGPVGAMMRERALKDGISHERRQFQIRYVEAQAEKLATKLALDKQIEERAKTIAAARKYRSE